MSTPINDGGAAFPSLQKVREDKPDGQLHWIQAGGMTLRDYFAGQALAGWIATLDIEPSDGFCGDAKIERQHQRSVADWMYGYADAMIAAREAQK